MKNRYLLVLGAKTTGAKHRTFSKDFLRFPKVNCRVHQERALTTEKKPKSSFCFTGERFVTMYFCCGPVCSPQIELIFDSQPGLQILCVAEQKSEGSGILNPRNPQIVKV